MSHFWIVTRMARIYLRLSRDNNPLIKALLALMKIRLFGSRLKASASSALLTIMRCWGFNSFCLPYFIGLSKLLKCNYSQTIKH